MKTHVLLYPAAEGDPAYPVKYFKVAEEQVLGIDRMLNGISFAIDLSALGAIIAVLLLTYFLWKWKAQFFEPSIYFSDTAEFEGLKKNKIAVTLAEKFTLLAFLCFLLAFLDPRFFIDRQTQDSNDLSKSPTEGIGIYLVLDQSGSMAEPAFTKSGATTKFELLKNVTRQFISERPNDLIGMIAFARGAKVLSPLTLDHASILAELSTFAPVKGTDQDGTSIGYAIYKAANMIAATRHYAEELKGKGEPAYTVNSTIMILITDGMQDPNPLDKGKRLRNIDIPEAAAYTKEQGIRLYIVNVDPKMATKEFAPYHHIMERAAQTTGGKFYRVDDSTALEDIYQEINTLEKNEILGSSAIKNKDSRPDLYRRISFFLYLIGLGLICLLLSVLCDSFLFRRIP